MKIYMVMQILLNKIKKGKIIETRNLEFKGKVTELPNAMFIKLENNHEILAHTAGKLRKNRIRVLAGDNVMVNDFYDLTKGRITFRFSLVAHIEQYLKRYVCNDSTKATTDKIYTSKYKNYSDN